MKQVTIDHQTIPALGIGSWHLGQGYHDADDEIRAIQTGVDAGIKLIDTAEMYGDGLSETLIGKAIQGRRDQVYLVTKVYPWNAKHLLMAQSCHDSLQRLNTDYIDLYLLHWRADSSLQEVVSCFQELKDQGKIRAWGVSNFDVKDMEDLYRIEQGNDCATNQVLYNPASRGIEFSLTPWCQHKNIPVMAYSPLNGQGTTLLRHPAIMAIANKYHLSPSTILLAWSMRNGCTIPIPESGNLLHMNNNIQALEFELDDHDLAMIDHHFPEPTKKVPLDVR